MHLHHRAFSLIEVVIATALFLVASVAVLESVVATRHLNSHGVAKDQIEVDSAAILRAMASDLSVSGWEFHDENATATYANAARAADRALRYYPMVQIQRSPGGGNTTGFNTDLPWTKMTDQALALPTLPVVLPGSAGDDLVAPLAEEAWRTSFHARSAQLVFLRATVGSWAANQDPGSAGDESVYRKITPAQYETMPPARIQQPQINFSLDNLGNETAWQDWRAPGDPGRFGVLFPSGFVETAPLSNAWIQRFPDQPYGVTLDAGWYDWADEDAPIKPAWESMRKPDLSNLPPIATMSLSDKRRAYLLAPERYREYMYAVIPSPTPLGLGRLVRAYRRPNADAIPAGLEPGQRITEVATDSGLIATERVAMVIDRVLSDDVVRVVFDTYRTVDAGATEVRALGINQVRVRLYFARRQVSSPNVILSRMVEATLSMRARSSSGDMQRVFASLGSSPIGVNR